MRQLRSRRLGRIRLLRLTLPLLWGLRLHLITTPSGLPVAFISLTPGAAALFDAAGIAEGDRTDRYRRIEASGDTAAFIDDCAAIRCWDRQLEQFAV